LDSYLYLKLIHILSGVIVAGTGIGIAYFMLMAGRSGNVQAIAVTARHVILGDWIFTAPAVVCVFGSGVLLMEKLGFSYTSPWFLTVLSLFVIIGICWLPVLRIQYQLKEQADISVRVGELTEDFRRLMRMWVLLGIPAFCAIVVIFWLMIFRPLPVS
jgi:uncharacterized membrane protein